MESAGGYPFTPLSKAWSSPRLFLRKSRLFDNFRKILVGNQLDAQFLLWWVYLNPLHVSSSSSGGLRRNRIYAASDIITLCRWLSCALVKKELLSICCCMLLSIIDWITCQAVGQWAAHSRWILYSCSLSCSFFLRIETLALDFL